MQPKREFYYKLRLIGLIVIILISSNCTENIQEGSQTGVMSVDYDFQIDPTYQYYPTMDIFQIENRLGNTESPFSVSSPFQQHETEVTWDILEWGYRSEDALEGDILEESELYQYHIDNRDSEYDYHLLAVYQLLENNPPDTGIILGIANGSLGVFDPQPNPVNRWAYVFVLDIFLNWNLREISWDALDTVKVSIAAAVHELGHQRAGLCHNAVVTTYGTCPAYHNDNEPWCVMAAGLYFPGAPVSLILQPSFCTNEEGLLRCEHGLKIQN